MREAAGAVVIGKTNTPEYGCKPVGESPVSGSTRNPVGHRADRGRLERRAGASVAAGLTPPGRGHRPRRIDPHPAGGAACSASRPGSGACRSPRRLGRRRWRTCPMARTVRDMALLFGVLGRARTRAIRLACRGRRGFRVAACGVIRGRCASRGRRLRLRAGRRAVAPSRACGPRLADLGCTVEEVDARFGADSRRCGPSSSTPASPSAGPVLRADPAQLDPDGAAIDEARRRAAATRSTSAQSSAAPRFGNSSASFFARYDVLLSPTLLRGSPASRFRVAWRSETRQLGLLHLSVQPDRTAAPSPRRASPTRGCRSASRSSGARPPRRRLHGGGGAGSGAAVGGETAGARPIAPRRGRSVRHPRMSAV